MDGETVINDDLSSFCPISYPITAKQADILFYIFRKSLPFFFPLFFKPTSSFLSLSLPFSFHPSIDSWPSSNGERGEALIDRYHPRGSRPFLLTWIESTRVPAWKFSFARGVVARIQQNRGSPGQGSGDPTCTLAREESRWIRAAPPRLPKWTQPKLPRAPAGWLQSRPSKQRE